MGGVFLFGEQSVDFSVYIWFNAIEIKNIYRMKIRIYIILVLFFLSSVHLQAQVIDSENSKRTRVIFDDMPIGFDWQRAESDTLQRRRWWYLQASGLHPDSVHTVLWCIDPKGCVPGLSVNGSVSYPWQDSVLVLEKEITPFLFAKKYQLEGNSQYGSFGVVFNSRPQLEQVAFISEKLSLDKSLLRLNNTLVFSSGKSKKEIERVVRDSFYLPIVRKNMERTN